MDQDFGIRVVSLKHMPRGFEFFPQLPMVINTPIEHHRNHRLLRLKLARDDRGLAELVGQVGTEVLAVVDHGLGATFVVDDAESSMDKCNIDDGAVVADRPITKAALPVWTSVFDGFVKNVEPCFGDRYKVRRWGAVLGIVNLDDARDAAH
jgi:hypothetical protein